MFPKILLTILFICLLVVSIGYSAECPKGTRTHLQHQLVNAPNFIRHDQSIGQTQFILYSDANNAELLNKTLEGQWFCLGFNQATKTYLLGGVFQIGAWLPLGSIQYLREEKNSLEPSAFKRLGYLANAAVVSPKGRYIAFIGGKQSTGDLYLLDTQTDTIKRLGAAPAPPPLANDAFSSDEPFEWGTGWADGYLEMEANIVYFTAENILQVSYGKDTSYVRAKKRQIRTFKLTAK